jgi:hypothetical protein
MDLFPDNEQEFYSEESIKSEFNKFKDESKEINHEDLIQE